MRDFAVHADDIATGLRQRNRHPLPEPGITTGDNGDFTCETKCIQNHNDLGYPFLSVMCLKEG